ncbi:hypothetical protein GGH94_002846 [Coemansia aciculifera]|uniref:Uncharacterized protein n=1 Tax=Coemansia aciculifera TaxID=417176 RepID=A0A9W8IRM2_9FUNG|nr:hypothetical protein GGH94_002846 [Coemansia aciculifera]
MTTFLLSGACGCWLVAVKVLAASTTQAHDAAASRFVRQLDLDEAKSRVPCTVLDDDTDDDSSDDDDDDDTEPSPLVNDTATNDSSDTVVPEANDVDNDTGAGASRGVEGPALRNIAEAGVKVPEASGIGNDTGADEVPPVNPDSDEHVDETAPNSAGAPRDDLSPSSKQPAEQVSADGATEEDMDTSIVTKTEQPKKPAQTTDAPDHRKKTSTADGTTAPALLTAKASHEVSGPVVNDAVKLSAASCSGNKVDAEAAKKARVEMASVEMDSARDSNRPTRESFVNNFGKKSSGESDNNRRSTVDSALDSIIAEGSTIADYIGVQPTVPRSSNSVPAGGDTGMQVDTPSISAGVRREEPSISAGSQHGETSAADAVMQDATIASNTGVLRVMEQPPADVEMEAANPPIVEVDMEERPPVADLDMADAERPADDDFDMHGSGFSNDDEDTASDNDVQMEVYVPILNTARVEAQMEVMQRLHRQPRARRPASAATPSLPINTFRFESNPLPPTPVNPAAGTFKAGSFNFGNVGNGQFGGNPGAQPPQPNTDADDDGSSDDDGFDDLVNDIEASLEGDARNPANGSGTGGNAQIDNARADKAKVDSEQIDYEKVDNVVRLYTGLSYIERQWLLDQAMSGSQVPTAIGGGTSFNRESVSAEEVLKLYNSLSDEERLEFICRAPEEK